MLYSLSHLHLRRLFERFLLILQSSINLSIFLLAVAGHSTTSTGLKRDASCGFFFDSRALTPKSLLTLASRDDSRGFEVFGNLNVSVAMR